MPCLFLVMRKLLRLHQCGGSMKIVLKLKKVRDPIARDLRTPKYRMKVVLSKKAYKRIKKVMSHEFE